MAAVDKEAQQSEVDLHVHDVTFMWRLLFDLRVDDGWMRDACCVRAWGAGHHVVREPAGRN